MDKINADMKEAEKNLTGMEKCCGICVCPCQKGKEFKEDASTWNKNEDGKVVNGQPARVMDDRNGTGPTSGYIAKITNDDREKEMEENMGQVSTMIGNLRNMAIDMGSEIESQNRQIDRINQKVSGSHQSDGEPLLSWATSGSAVVGAVSHLSSSFTSISQLMSLCSPITPVNIDGTQFYIVFIIYTYIYISP
ncbi:synaptosomal-associated protein 25-like [Tropilaelaps mercedesae]|uniref:Synaptosomal-associated protein n=1 Tax=Tropilaelaps mercedesae TaxID=418985 RepID=A0A1V9XMY9_9ACAR|nr:synaptosomal-associated protein 25-like [Tropilaelaps mercedesae]